MSSDVVDFQARSLEGRGLSMKAQERWVDIQKHTFLNWVNLQLQGSGLNVTDPEADFDDGVRLCALVESLQNRKIGRVIKKPMNHHQNLENVTLALNAIAEDNVRLVNIGSEDIVNGSTKLILGLVWTLILRYQIGKTKIPPKKLMLAWLKAVVPECAISNFTSDWNDGVALHALVDYCQPGLCPNWRQLSRHSRLENCTEAMEMAKEKLNIPIVVRPEDYSSSHLDDLSGMTYLSYFMMVDAPGYMATRREIRALLQEGTIDNFTTDWNDGRLLANLVTSVGGNPPEVTSDSVQTLQNGIDSARQLGIEPIFAAKEIADPEVEHLGVMAYAAYFRKFEPVKRKFNSARMQGEFDDVMVRQEKRFYVTAEDGTDHSVIRAELTGPDSTVPVRIDWSGDTADCSFTPTETGHHKLNVTCEEKHVPGSPVTFKVSSDRSKVHFEPLDKAVVGYNSELIVDTTEAGEGEVRMEAESPSGKVVNFPVMYKNGIHMANFTPSEIGDWQMSMIYEGDHITGSPYTLPVIDPTLVQVTDLGDGKVGQENSFEVDASMAGNGELRTEVYHDGWTVPCPLEILGPGRYRASFMPQSTGTYRIHVYLGDIEVRGSPQEVEVVDTTRVTMTGEGLSLVPVNTPAIFTIHTTGAGGGKVDVDITAPSGYKVPWTIKRLNKDTYKVEYRVTQPGEYTINVQFGGQEVTKTPLVTKAYDSKRLMVSNMPTVASRDKPVYFNIDAAQAGSGNIEIRVNEGRVPCSVENKGNHRFVASFMPENSRPHAVEMSFNDMAVEGSPWSVDIVDKNNISVTGEEWVQTHRSASASVVTNGQKVTRSDLQVIVTGPEGENVPFNLSNEPDGDCSVHYTPTAVGNYDISVKYGGQEVSGSPFVAKAYNTGAILVTPIKDGFVNQPMFFTIDVGDAGEGQLQIMVNNGNIRNEVEPQDPGIYRIKFVPVEVGRQEVAIKFNDHDVPNSPLVCMALDLTANVVGLNPLIPIMVESSFSIKSQSPVADVNTDVSITAPNGEKIAARLIQQADGDYKVEWTPNNPGRHSVDVLYGGQQIQGSPFFIDVFDIHKIRVNNFYCGNVGEKAGFRIDCTQAGQGDQEIRVQSATGRIVPHHVEETAHLDYNVSYTPVEVGTHQVFISYSGMELNGSPFHQEIFEGALPSASGDGLYRGEEDKPASFIIDARRMHGEPTVQVDGPQSIAKCNIDHLPDGQYKVTYIPVEVGIFTAQVKWNGKDIPGSPFHPKIVNALKVRVIGGWQHYMDSQERVHLVVGEEKEIPFDTSEAGSGHLRAEVKSPSGFIKVNVDEEHKGKSVVKFVPQEEGVHYINLYWCDHPLVNSPYLGYATSGVADPSKVILTGRGVKEGVVREEAEFIIDGSQAGPGEPDVQLIGVRAEIQVFTTPLGGGKYRCTYIPVIPGAYLLHISWNGRQLRGSPYKVNVIGASYPNRVIVNGEGLKGGLLGQNLDFRIDTRKAGPGELTAYCMGPSKVAYCELSDHHDGTYRLAVRAQEVGNHVLQIKYGGEHVQGSPFHFKVSAQPDASKVRVSGPGVEHGLLANYQSNFIVETKGAGAGQLTVRIRGPKGAFQVEMYRESHKDRTILCRYYPTVTGLYIINVRWSGVDVPGSPFHVNILDTHQELEHVLRDQGYTPNGHQTSFNSNGSGMINHHHLHNNNHSSSRVAYHQQQQIHQSSQNHAHNTSRSSGYYAWRGDD